MNREDDPDLWDLLSRSKTAEPSPFFSRNVLRAIRNEPAPSQWNTGWATFRRFVAPLSAVAAVLITAATLHTLHTHRASQGSDMWASAETQDAEMVADLDLLTSDDDADDVSVL